MNDNRSVPPAQMGGDDAAEPLGLQHAEDLALLLEGRLTGDRRQALLAQLAASPELLALYSEVVAVTQQIEANALPSDGASGAPHRATSEMVSIGTTRRRWGMTAALATAAVLVVSVSIRQWRARTVLGSPAESIAQLQRQSENVTALPSPFPAVRSSGDSTTLRGTGTRMGVELAHGMVLASGSAIAVTEVRAHLDRAIDLLERAPAAPLVAQALRRRVQRAPAESLASLLSSTAVDAERFLDAPTIRVAAWLTTLRVAAIARDAAFLESRSMRAGLAALQRIAESDAELLAESRTLAQLVSAPEPNWSAIDDSAIRTLRILGK